MWATRDEDLVAGDRRRSRFRSLSLKLIVSALPALSVTIASIVRLTSERALLGGAQGRRIMSLASPRGAKWSMLRLIGSVF